MASVAPGLAAQAVCGDGNLDAGEQCDDGNTSGGDCCSTTCTIDPDQTPCTDGNGCTVIDSCSGGVCVPGPLASCNDDNDCTNDYCDPSFGCANVPITGPCEDGDLCTTGDTCSGGFCVAGGPADCDDAEPCTDDSCDSLIGCVNSANSASCSDGNPCTMVDSCSGGVCVPGPLPNCSDDNDCTNDYCDPSFGCANVPITGPCEDGDLCTTGDMCMAGNCVPGAPACDSVSGTVGPGGELTTDTEAGGDGASPSDPIETAVTTPSGGFISIDEGPLDPGDPDLPTGFSFLGQVVVISAPLETASDPLEIVFTIDASLYSGDIDDILIFRDPDGAGGSPPVEVGDCIHATEAQPDPCLASRVEVGDDDVITVRTSAASRWMPAVSLAGAVPVLSPAPWVLLAGLLILVGILQVRLRSHPAEAHD